MPVSSSRRTQSTHLEVLRSASESAAHRSVRNPVTLLHDRLLETAKSTPVRVDMHTIVAPVGSVPLSDRIWYIRHAVAGPANKLTPVRVDTNTILAPALSEARLLMALLLLEHNSGQLCSK